MISATKPKGSRVKYIGWLGPNAYAISWEIDKTRWARGCAFPSGAGQ